LERRSRGGAVAAPLDARRVARSAAPSSGSAAAVAGRWGAASAVVAAYGRSCGRFLGSRLIGTVAATSCAAARPWALGVCHSSRRRRPYPLMHPLDLAHYISALVWRRVPPPPEMVTEVASVIDGLSVYHIHRRRCRRGEASAFLFFSACLICFFAVVYPPSSGGCVSDLHKVDA